MTTFDALDGAAQALVLENANPLDVDSMTAVTNAVDAIEALNDVISGDSTDSIADAIAVVRATMDLALATTQGCRSPLMVVLALALLMHRRW